MNVLFVIPYVPNLIRVRPFNLIRYLSKRGHRVTLLTLWTNEQELADIEGLRLCCDEVIAFRQSKPRSYFNCLITMPTPTPLQAVYCWNPELARSLSDYSLGENGKSRPDIIHIEHLRGARYGLYLKSQPAFSQAPIPVIWDSVDCISLLFRKASSQSHSVLKRLLLTIELNRTEAHESMLVKRFNSILVTSSADREALYSLPSALNPGNNIHILPNGVDLEYFCPDERVPRQTNTIVISGKMSYHANIAMVLYFVKEIFPIVLSRRPEVKLEIVGKDPSQEIMALTQHPAITVTGTVPDLRDYLRHASIAVAPIRYGVGIQNKVLEAMACRTPVVATPQAVSALETSDGRDIMVAKDAGEFANAILGLLTDDGMRNQVASAGRKYVEDHHQWSKIVERLESIYEHA